MYLYQRALLVAISDYFQIHYQLHLTLLLSQQMGFTPYVVSLASPIKVRIIFLF